MPDPLAYWWDLTYFRRMPPETGARRPCGCYTDPVVFGHYHLPEATRGLRMALT